MTHPRPFGREKRGKGRSRRDGGVAAQAPGSAPRLPQDGARGRGFGARWLPSPTREPRLLDACARVMIARRGGYGGRARRGVAPSRLLSWHVSCDTVRWLVGGWKWRRVGIYLGGRLVFGSGSCWPHDLRFLTTFFSGCVWSPPLAAAVTLSLSVWASKRS